MKSTALKSEQLNRTLNKASNFSCSIKAEGTLANLITSFSSPLFSKSKCFWTCLFLIFKRSPRPRTTLANRTPLLAKHHKNTSIQQLAFLHKPSSGRVSWCQLFTKKISLFIYAFATNDTSFPENPNPLPESALINGASIQQRSFLIIPAFPSSTLFRQNNIMQRVDEIFSHFKNV